MNTLEVKFDEHAIDVKFTKTALHFVLADGREISAPLEWFPRLRDANESDKKNGDLLVKVLECIGRKLIKIFQLNR